MAALRTDGQVLIKQKSREERWFDPGHIEAGGKWVPPQLLLLIRLHWATHPLWLLGVVSVGVGEGGF